MILLALLACGRPPGDYEPVLGDPVSDCAPEDVPVAIPPWSWWIEDHPGSVELWPYGEDCPKTGDHFTCALADWDFVVDYADLGLAAVVTQDLGIEGAWTEADTLDGTLSWETSCDGADCAALAGHTPPLCATQWDWSATKVENGAGHGVCSQAEPAVEIEPLGHAPWDPIRAWDEHNRYARPAIGSDAGYEPTEHLGFSDGLYRMVGEPSDQALDLFGAWVLPVEPGWGDDGCPDGPMWAPLDREWEVGAFGHDPTFTPGAALGSWDVDLDTLYVGGDSILGFIVTSYLTGLRLEVLAVDAGEAEIRLIAPMSSGEGECVVLWDQAELSATGDLTWSVDRIEAATDPDPLVIHDGRIRLGFDASGAEAAGGEVSAVVDARATEGTEFDLCASATCTPCPDDGHASCLAFDGFAATATRTDAPVGEELPLCGADFSDTGVVPDVSIDCGDGWDGSLCVGAWIAVLAPLVRRRRVPGE